MTIAELKKIAKEFEGEELIFLLSVLTEEEIDKLIKEKILIPKKGSKDIMDYKIDCNVLKNAGEKNDKKLQK